jgi:hypothetical protein
MTRIGALAAVLIVLIPTVSRAQDPSAWGKYIQVRKAFDGASEEEKPANLGLVNPGKDSPVYWLLDGGIRLTPRETYFGESAEDPSIYKMHLIWYPSVEWHHMSAEPLARQEATNAGGAAINAEFWFHRTAPDALRVYLVTQAAVDRDVLNATTDGAASVKMGFIRTPRNASDSGGFSPGTPLKIGDKEVFEYFPYIGVEYLRNLAITQDDTDLAPTFDGGDILLKVDFEATPFHRSDVPGRSRFVIGGAYEYRRILKASAALDSQNLQFMNVDLSYYFTVGRAVGIGLTLDNGRSPMTNFVTQHRSALVLKAKL